MSKKQADQLQMDEWQAEWARMPSTDQNFTLLLLSLAIYEKLNALLSEKTDEASGPAQLMNCVLFPPGFDPVKRAAQITARRARRSGSGRGKKATAAKTA